MKQTRTKSKSGFSLLELVVVISILGILTATAYPAYSKMQAHTQKNRNIANMNVIRETFFQYYYRMHLAGNPHFPTAPQNEEGVMDTAWAATPIDSTISLVTPNDLFSTGDVPMNANGNPFYYNTTYQELPDGRMRHTIIIEDHDDDSPSYNESLIYSI